ncbi:hypothetical protein SAMN05444365_103578 [Micromonospora pattaloongensis]|uniref:Uncharacterized protein n=1 Tax=Micromonospora pattaloongensis TaxID=405436 RepID=A0A1H3MYZ7_9ACTN|nr:hypothetical protein [Micromonospora pattaloongensis]SDY81758.1 hypothetical protein SAMN05444365_103578 [Micromonospora pattaloongensis]
MSLIRPAALGLATLMAGPALWRAFVTQTLDVQSALTRFLIAVPIAAIMLAALRIITESYRRRPRLFAELQAQTQPTPTPTDPTPTP